MMKKLILSLLAAVLLLTVLQLPANALHVLEEEGQRIAAAADTITFPADGTEHTAVCQVCEKVFTGRLWKMKKPCASKVFLTPRKNPVRMRYEQYLLCTEKTQMPPL